MQEYFLSNLHLLYSFQSLHLSNCMHMCPYIYIQVHISLCVCNNTWSNKEIMITILRFRTLDNIRKAETKRCKNSNNKNEDVRLNEQ